MDKLTDTFRRTALASSLAFMVAGLSGPATASDDAIAEIIDTWQPLAKAQGWTPHWQPEFTAALEAATDDQLVDIMAASTYGEVQTVLRGGELPELPDGLDGANAIGQAGQDLVFTPVVPCRIFDTRLDFDGATPPAGGNPGSVFSYFVHGTPAQIGAQGGNPAGCTSPGGEPSAIAANFTVVPFGQGHIRAYPFNAPQPTASFLNYTAGGGNLANAGIIATAFNIGLDLSVATFFGQAHSLSDVMGYFYVGVLAANTVGQTQIVTGGVGSTEVADGSLNANDLASNSVGAAEIQSGAVGQSEIAANGVGASEIATGAVASAEVLDNSLRNNDISDEAGIEDSTAATQASFATCTTYTTVRSFQVSVPASSNTSYVFCQASGDIDFDNANAELRVGIDGPDAGNSPERQRVLGIEGVNLGSNDETDRKTFAVQNVYTVGSAGATQIYSLVACQDGAVDPGTLNADPFVCLVLPTGR